MYRCRKCGLFFVVDIYEKHIKKCDGKEDTKLNMNFEETSDNINPDHYKKGGIETFDYMKAKMSEEQLEGYLMGNVLKYVSRYQFKNGVEDLKKSQWYLDKLIELKG